MAILPRLAAQLGSPSEATTKSPSPGRDCVLDLAFHFVAATALISMERHILFGVASGSHTRGFRLKRCRPKLLSLPRS
jgi:hypothetical protein